MSESIYKRMYMILAHGITDSLEQLEQMNVGHAADLLRGAMGEAEDYYIQLGDRRTAAKKRKETPQAEEPAAEEPAEEAVNS